MASQHDGERKRKKKKKKGPGGRHLAQRQWKAQRTMGRDDVHHQLSSGVSGHHGAAHAEVASTAPTAPSEGSAAFEAYYRRQLAPLLGDDEEERDMGWRDLVSCLSRALPVCFRLNAASAPGAVTATLRQRLARSGERGHRGATGDLQFPGTFIQAGGNAIAIVAAPLSATLGELGATRAWQLGTDRANLKRCAALRPLHAVLVREMVLGNLNRQEACSMLPALLAGVEAHHAVLDMCAAPGSKTRQLAELMLRRRAAPGGGARRAAPLGVLVANDPDPPRAKLLAKQFARSGAAHVVVTCERGEDVAAKLNMAGRFDRVLADVPCSGDGTLRKQPELWRKWREDKGALLQPLQLRLAKAAVLATKVGGVAVYSTCALNPIEDEAVVAALLRSVRPAGALELVDAAAAAMPRFARRRGLAAWWERPAAGAASSDGTGFVRVVAPAALHLERCMRVLPHDGDTGGFFVAVLRKTAECTFAAAASHAAAGAATATIAAPDQRAASEADALAALRGVGFNAKAASTATDTLRALQVVEGSSAVGRALRAALAQPRAADGGDVHVLSAAGGALGRAALGAIETDGTIEWRSAHYRLRRSDFAPDHLPRAPALSPALGGRAGAHVHALSARAAQLVREATPAVQLVAAGVVLARLSAIDAPSGGGAADCALTLTADAAVCAARAAAAMGGAPPSAAAAAARVVELSRGDFLWLAATALALVDAQFRAASTTAKAEDGAASLTNLKVARALANAAIDVDASGAGGAAQAFVLKRGDRPRAPRIAASALFAHATLRCGAEASGGLRTHKDKRWIDAAGRRHGTGKGRGGQKKKGGKGKWRSGGSGTSDASAGSSRTRKLVTLSLSAAGRALIVAALLSDAAALNVLFVTGAARGAAPAPESGGGGAAPRGAGAPPPPRKRLSKAAEKRAKKKAREAYLAQKAAKASGAAAVPTAPVAGDAPSAVAPSTRGAAPAASAATAPSALARPTLLCRSRPDVATDGRDDPHLIVLTAADRLRSYADALGWFL